MSKQKRRSLASVTSRWSLNRRMAASAKRDFFENAMRSDAAVFANCRIFSRRPTELYGGRTATLGWGCCDHHSWECAEEVRLLIWRYFPRVAWYLRGRMCSSRASTSYRRGTLYFLKWGWEAGFWLSRLQKKNLAELLQRCKETLKPASTAMFFAPITSFGYKQWRWDHCRPPYRARLIKNTLR